MTLEEVANSVVEKGRREADLILKEGGKEVLRILSEADKEITATKQKQLAMANKEVKDLRARETSGMEMKVRRERLNAEREAFDRIRSKALADLLAASRPRKDAILGHLISKAKRVIDSGQIYCNAQDAEFIKTHAGTLKFGGIIDCNGGIVIESSDRKERVDLTYETMFDEVWDRELAQVHKIIFQG